jgi:hypothetical protein
MDGILFWNLFQMSWNIELTLNTDYQRFESWLDRYRTLPFIVNLENGKTLHVAGAPTLNREYQGCRFHEVRASIGKPSPTDPTALELSWHFPVVEIELFEGASNRLSVKIECKHPALFEYYLNLLAAIVKRYPEAGKTVLDYLTKLAPNKEKQAEMETFTNLPFATVKDKLENYLWKIGLGLKITLQPYKTELPEGQAYNVIHTDYGELGQLSIHPRENQTRIRFTKPIVPTHEEATKAYIQAGYNVPKKAFDAIDWLMEQREKENQAFYDDLLKHFEEITPTHAVQSGPAAKPKKPNAQINERAMIFRTLDGWMKLGNVRPTPKECIAELKKKLAYRNMTISTKRMQKILDEGFAGKYDDILKNV